MWRGAGGAASGLVPDGAAGQVGAAGPPGPRGASRCLPQGQAQSPPRQLPASGPQVGPSRPVTRSGPQRPTAGRALGRLCSFRGHRQRPRIHSPGAGPGVRRAGAGAHLLGDRNPGARQDLLVQKFASSENAGLGESGAQDRQGGRRQRWGVLLCGPHRPPLL